jgi:formylglycine-generating enzyme required for sulfatase activity
VIRLLRATAALVVLAWALPLAAQHVGETPRVKVPSGFYKPFYKTKGVDSVRIPALEMDAYPVTNAQYLEFVRSHPAWTRSRVSRVMADDGYLKHWRSDLDVGDESILNSPVTNVSWFAAREYAAWRGDRLPTVNEWEHAASFPLTWPVAATGKAKDKLILDWYSKPKPKKLSPVGTANRNSVGLFDMFGQVWEWVADFNSIVIPNDPRGGLDTRFFCGSGAFGTLDPSDYATFMRFAMRNSLKASYTVENLGFRCVREVK